MWVSVSWIKHATCRKIIIGLQLLVPDSDMLGYWMCCRFIFYSRNLTIKIWHIIIHQTIQHYIKTESSTLNRCGVNRGGLFEVIMEEGESIQRGWLQVSPPLFDRSSSYLEVPFTAAPSWKGQNVQSKHTKHQVTLGVDITCLTSSIFSKQTPLKYPILKSPTCCIHVLSCK